MSHDSKMGGSRALEKIFFNVVPGRDHGRVPAVDLLGPDLSNGGTALRIGDPGGRGPALGDHPAPMAEILLRLVRGKGPCPVVSRGLGRDSIHIFLLLLRASHRKTRWVLRPLRMESGLIK